MKEAFVETLRLAEAKRAQLLAKLQETEDVISEIKGLHLEGERPVHLRPFFDEVEPPQHWIIEQYLPKGSVAMLTSEGGVGKTTLLSQWTLAMAQGVPCFQFIHPENVRVLYLLAEGNRMRFRERLKVTAQSMGIKRPDMKEIFWYLQPKGLPSFSLASVGIERMIEASRPDLVVMDTLGYFFTGDENSASEWKQKAMAPLRRLAESHGCSFLFVHHNNKPAPGREGWQKGRGSSAMQGDCDLWMRLETIGRCDTNPDPPERHLFVDKNKYGPDHFFRKLLYDKERAIFRSVP